MACVTTRLQPRAHQVHAEFTVMTEPIVIRKTLLVAAVTALRALAPPLVALACLYLVARDWASSYHDFSAAPLVIAAVLCLSLVQFPRDVSSELHAPAILTAG